MPAIETLRQCQAVVYVCSFCRSGAVAVWCVQRRMAPDVFSFHSATPWRWLRAAPSSGDEASLVLGISALRNFARFSFTLGIRQAWFIMGHHKSAESNDRYCVQVHLHPLHLAVCLWVRCRRWSSLKDVSTARALQPEDPGGIQLPATAMGTPVAEDPVDQVLTKTYQDYV